jgi:hypothetical protein
VVESGDALRNGKRSHRPHRRPKLTIELPGARGLVLTPHSVANQIRQTTTSILLPRVSALLSLTFVGRCTSNQLHPVIMLAATTLTVVLICSSCPMLGGRMRCLVLM